MYIVSPPQPFTLALVASLAQINLRPNNYPGPHYYVPSKENFLYNKASRIIALIIFIDSFPESNEKAPLGKRFEKERYR